MASRFGVVPGAIASRAQAVFDRLVLRTPGGRTEFFDTEAYPWIAEVEKHADEIRAELESLLENVDHLPNFQDIQEEQIKLTQDDLWKVFLLYGYGARAEENCQRCPRTAQIVEAIPGMTTAMFSVLRPHKHIPPHVGPWKGVLRYHLALRTPADESLTRIRVGNSIRHWRNGHSMLFDDTFEHEVWNDSDETRVVLFVDVIRDLPWYLALPNRGFIGLIRNSPFIKRALANSEAWQETFPATAPTPPPGEKLDA